MSSDPDAERLASNAAAEAGPSSGLRRSCGAAGLEVIVRLDMRLPALNRQCLPVPSFGRNSTYSIFHCTSDAESSFQGVSRGARPAVAPISMVERFVKFHCGRCMKPLPENNKYMALNKGAWYWVCRGCGKQD
jgi:hypothetical protein